MMKVWTAFLLICAAASVVAWIVALCHENRLGAIGGLMRQMRRMPKVGRVVLGILFVGMWLYGSVKQSGGVGSEGVGENHEIHETHEIEGMETNQVFNAENAEAQEAQRGDLDNVANVEVLPLTNSNTQLGIGNIGTGNTITMATLENSHLSSPITHYSSLITHPSSLITHPSSLITPVICEDWLKFGGYEDWIYIDPGAWSFRYGANFVERLAVFSSGKIRLFGNGVDAILPLIDTHVSIAPVANWERIVFGHVERVDRVDGSESVFNAETQSSGGAQSGDGGDFNRVDRADRVEEGGFELMKPEIRNQKLETDNSQLTTPNSSLFWHAETSSNTLVLTWQNALLNRRADSPVNIQAELFPAGEMRVTHDLSGEIVTEYLPAPELPISDTLDEVMARIEGGNSNAYFYANVMAAKGPAIVRVHCDGASSLGDYSILAYPGVINSLPLLIGPKYKIECEAAFSHFSVSDDEVEVRHLSDRCSEVSWPVKISFEESGADNGNAFDIVVDPSFLDGTVVWDEQMKRSAGCRCCNLGTNGTVTVSADCECDSCEHKGRYEYEGHQEYFGFYHEREKEDTDEPEEPGEPPEEQVASVSIRFDKSAVIFEDEYENAPGEFVPRRSTRTTLRCTACGGERGGNLTVDLSGMGALRLVSGTPPTSRTLAQYETVEFEAVYEGEAASSQENGTVARVTFTENETNITFDDDAEVTVIKITTETDVEKPSYRQRKNIGVGEVVEILIEPKDAQVDVFSSRGNLFQNGSGAYMYDTPTSRQNDDITIKSELVEMLIQFCIFEPSGFSVRGIVGTNSNAIGEAGDFSAKIFYYPLPTNVSFHAVEFVEVGMVSSDPTGYFADEARRSWLDHSLWGAGEWFKLAGYDDYFVDDIAMPPLPKPWGTGGAFTWPVPVGWRCAGEKGVTNIVCYHNQRFELEANGTSRIKKMGCIVERGTNNYFSATRSF